MFLESPHGTKSQLIYPRLRDALTRRKTYNDLVVTSLHFWGESATAESGKWKLLFNSAAFRHRNIEGELLKFKITFYGTEQDPVRGGGLAKDMTFCEYGKVNKSFWSAYGNMCCGATGIYDNNVAKCCNGEKLVPKSSFCGSVVYDQCTHLCCNENLHPRIEGITSCCGKNSYNVKTQICCNERPELKYKCFEQWYNWKKYYIKHEAECGHRGVFYRRNSHESCPVCRDVKPTSDCKRWEKMSKFCSKVYSKFYCAKTCNRCN